MEPQKLKMYTANANAKAVAYSMMFLALLGIPLFELFSTGSIDFSRESLGRAKVPMGFLYLVAACGLLFSVLTNRDYIIGLLDKTNVVKIAEDMVIVGERKFDVESIVSSKLHREFLELTFDSGQIIVIRHNADIIDRHLRALCSQIGDR